MNKSQKMKKAARKNRNNSLKKRIVKIISWPWRACCALWNWFKRICRTVWNWLKSIDIIGMINLTLLVVIIILFLSLIFNFVRCNKCASYKVSNRNNNVSIVEKQTNTTDSRKVVKRTFKTTLPIRSDKQTNIKPKIKTVGVAKPQVVKELSLPAKELPQQVLSGDVIVDNYPSSPVLSNGVKINGNLFIQNMRKYTIPCDAKINGHLFIRNVSHLNFCGKFKVNGNVYVNRGSAFGAIPQDAQITGQIIL